MFGLSKYIIAGSALALVLTGAWGARVNHLRGQWKAKYESLDTKVRATLVSVEMMTGAKNLTIELAPVQILALGAERDQWRVASNDQTAAINHMRAETERLTRLSDDLRKQAQAAIARRDTALKQLDTMALTPGERADCVGQLTAAEAALNLVWEQGL